MTNVRLKIWQKSIFYALLIIGWGIAIGLPLYVLSKDLIIGYWYVKKARFSFVTMISLVVFGVTVFLPLKAWYKRKLQALSVANELNAIGMTSPLIKWLLVFLQFAIPLGVATALIYAFHHIQIPNYKLFMDFYLYFIGGFVVLVANDYLKAHFITINEVAQQVRLDEKKEKLKVKKSYKVKN